MLYSEVKLANRKDLNSDWLDTIMRPSLRSTTRLVQQRVSNFSSKMSPKLFNAVKV